MKKLLAKLDWTRSFLAGSLLLSLLLAVNGVRLHQRRSGLQDALEVQVPRLAQDIQINSRRFTRLYEEAEGAGLLGQQDAQSYLRELAIHPDVKLGGIDFRPQAIVSPAKGVIDVKLVVQPQPRDRSVIRTNLANFMHLIEQRSRRMRVTHVRLDREGNPRPWEYGNDRWTWELEVTSRQKQEAE